MGRPRISPLSHGAGTARHGCFEEGDVWDIPGYPHYPMVQGHLGHGRDFTISVYGNPEHECNFVFVSLLYQFLVCACC